jgi:predicted amino acid dehydrogenase
VVGDGGISLAKRLNIAVTTGNSYTVATAVQGAVQGANRMGIELKTATVAVVGATGSIGATCAEILARDAASVHLVGRTPEKLETLAHQLERQSPARIRVFTDVATGLADADIIITVSSAAKAIVEPQHIKSGAVVCDVARPRDVSVAVARERDDVLVIEGGVVRVPGEMRCTKVSDGSPFSFGFPQGTAYACMSETIALALDGRYENFTLGKEVSVSQVDEITAVCSRHGFILDGFRSFERALSAEEIELIRQHAQRKKRVTVS